MPKILQIGGGVNLSSLFNLTYGIYVISSKSGEKFNACIVNSVFQVTAENPTIAISVAKNNLTHEYIKESKVFTISILKKETPLLFIGKFGFKSGRTVDKFSDTKFDIGITGAPFLRENSLTYVEAEVINSVEVGTHTIFIGKIVECENLCKAEPLTYSYYHKTKGGKSSKNAPTFAQQSAENVIIKEKKEELKAKYVCDVCGYVYDFNIGDDVHGIKSNTAFNDLPKDWKCPICGVGKNKFTKIN